MNTNPPLPSEPEPCVDADAVARLLLVSVETVRKYTLTAGLPFIALPGGRRRYVLSQVVAWRDKRTTRLYQIDEPKTAPVRSSHPIHVVEMPIEDQMKARRAEINAMMRSVTR